MTSHLLLRNPVCHNRHTAVINIFFLIKLNYLFYPLSRKHLQDLLLLRKIAIYLSISSKVSLKYYFYQR